MGWLDRLLSSGSDDDDVSIRPDAGMGFRAGIMREAVERAEARAGAEAVGGVALHPRRPRVALQRPAVAPTQAQAVGSCW